MVVNRDRVVLADTNVMSYVFKRQSLGQQYGRLLIGHEVRIAFVTLAEMHEWAEGGGGGVPAAVWTYGCSSTDIP